MFIRDETTRALAPVVSDLWFVLNAWCYRRCLLYHWRTRRPSLISWSGSRGTLTATTSSTEGWPPHQRVARLLVAQMGVNTMISPLSRINIHINTIGVTSKLEWCGYLWFNSTHLIMDVEEWLCLLIKPPPPILILFPPNENNLYFNQL